MLDELRQMAIFAKTVDHGSFRAAARALRLSPSVISHHVNQLEERLGTALLYRSTRRLALTEDGKRLLLSARAIIEAAESGLREVAESKHQLSGELRVTVPALLAHAGITHRFGQFVHLNPLVQLSIDYSDTRRELIGDGYDIAIRAGDMQDSALKSRKLFSFERRLVAAPAYVQNRNNPNNPLDLKDWDWLELTPVGHKKRVFKSGRKVREFATPKPVISVNNAHALTQLATTGAGAAIIPEFLAEPEVNANRLTYILDDWHVDPIAVFAVWPANAPRDGLIKHFLDFIANSLRED